MAQFAVDRGSGREGSRGSGYLIAPGRVLTAAHVVAGASAIRVRLDVGQDTEIDVLAEGWWADSAGYEGTDLAVVTIPEDATAGREIEPAWFGQIGDCAAVLEVTAFGFPRFKLKANDRTGLGEVFRDLEQVTGHAPVAANRRQGTLAVYLDDPAPPEPPQGNPSPWAGISGGAVWVADRIVAVVAEHHPSEGTGRLTARRIDRVYEALSAPALDRLVSLSGLPPVRAGLHGVVPADVDQLVRSAYLAQVRDIAPNELIGREDELAEWAGFCAGIDPYGWWQAGPWAGKSALAARFATHPPAGIDVVSFFITGRLPGQADSDAFLDAMIEQLNALYPISGSFPVRAGARAGTWLTLLDSVASRTEDRGRRLVVVVDGLDEDDVGAIPIRGRPSIVSLLPRRPPPATRFIVTSRPNPGLPDDLPIDHPLQTCVPRSLPASPIAQGMAMRARQELRSLLGGDQLAVDVVSYIAASGGGLTHADLSDVTGAPPHKLDSILRGVSGRSLETRATNLYSTQHDPESRVYLFAHETLRVAAEEQLGNELTHYRQKIHEWIDKYSSAYWPDASPSYAIQSYPHMLAATNDITRLSELIRDPHRHAFLLRSTGSDYAALSELRIAQIHIAEQDIPDLRALAELAAYQHATSIGNQSIPAVLPILWSQLARFDHAEALAHTIADSDTLAWALGELAIAAAQASDLDRSEALAQAIAKAVTHSDAYLYMARAFGRATGAIIEAGDLDRAYRLATNVKASTRVSSFPDPLDEVLGELAIAIAQAGDLARAEALIHTMANPGAQAQPLAQLGAVAAQAGDLGRAHRLVAEAEALAHTITNYSAKASALTKVAIATAKCSNFDQAEAFARTITEPYDRAQALAELGVLAAQAGDLDWAYQLATDAKTLVRSGDYLGPVVPALAKVATAIASTGDIDRAEALGKTINVLNTRASDLGEVAFAIAKAGALDRAKALVRTITDPRAQATALAQLGVLAAHAGDVNRAHRLVADAEALARTITNFLEQPEAFAEVASVITEAGDPDRGEALARAITDPHDRDRALAKVAAAIAKSGDPDRGEALARAITEPLFQTRALAEVATVIANTGELDRAEALVRIIADPGAQAEALARLGWLALQAGDLDRAYRLASDSEALVHTFIDPRAQAEALAELSAVAAQAGNTDSAEAVAHTITDPDARGRAFAEVSIAIAKTSDLDRAEAFSRTIDHLYYKAQAFARLGVFAAQAGDLDRAYQLATAPKALIRHISRYDDPVVRDLADVAIAIAKAGDLDRAEALGLAIIKLRGYGPEQGMVAAAIAQAGDLNRAKKLVRKVTGSREHAQALAQLTVAMAQAGDLDRAEKLAKLVIKALPETTQYLDVVMTLPEAVIAIANTGDLDRAYRLVTDAEAVARTITEPLFQTRALVEVATVIAKIGDLDRAYSLAVDSGIQTEVFGELAEVAAEAGDLDRAEALVEGITDSSTKAWALAKVAAGTARAGHYDRAESLARSITVPYQQSYALTKVATTIVKAGHLDRAEALAETMDDPYQKVRLLTDAATAAFHAGDLARARRLSALILITDPPSIKSVGTVSHFFPSEIRDAWNALVSAYMGQADQRQVIRQKIIIRKMPGGGSRFEFLG